MKLHIFLIGVVLSNIFQGTIAEVQSGILCTSAALSLPRANLAAASIMNKVIFAGGQINGQSSRVDIYDANSDSWSTKELSVPRARLSASVVGSAIVFSPGMDNQISMIDIYNATTNQWTNISSPFKDTTCSAGTKDFFLIPTDNNLNIYNIHTNTWKTRKLTISRAVLCIPLENKVLFLGQGKDSTYDTADVYDVDDDTLTTTKLINATIYAPGFCKLNNLAIIAGLSETANIYHAKNNSWTTTVFPFWRVSYSAAALEDRYCLFGGGLNPQKGPAENSRVDVYDSWTNQWTTSSFTEAKALHAATSLGTRAYFGGGISVWDDWGSTSSVVNIYEKVTFDLSLQNVTARIGDEITFNVTAIKGVNYEWRKNNAVLPWSTSNIFTTMKLTLADDQSYYQVFLFDQCGNKYKSNIIFISLLLSSPTPTPSLAPSVVPFDAPVERLPNDNTLIFKTSISGVVLVLIIAALIIFFRRQRNRLATEEGQEALLQTIYAEHSRDPTARSQNISEQTIIPYEELEIGDKLGEGSFGEVLVGKWHNQSVAVKKLKNTHRDTNKIDVLLEEAKTLKSVHHQHVVMLFGVAQNPSTKEVLLVMENMRNGSLHRLLFVDKVALSLQSLIRIALDVARGLDFLHHLTPKIIHRDLKSENVLLYRNKSRAKISDFGTARLLHEESVASTVVGTLGYIAPEILQQKPYTEKVDVFSFGVLLYELCSNSPMPVIFEERDRETKINTDVAYAPLRDLVLKCCKNESTERPTMNYCIKELHELKVLNKN